MSKKIILLVEDDASVAERLSGALPVEAYQVVHLSDPSQTLRLALEGQVDAIILDRVIGPGDTSQLIAGWRESGLNIPILILSSMAGLRDRIEGLHAGADAYLTKPFDPLEIEAKLKALFRMGDRHAAGSDPDIIKIGALTLDRRRREARVAGSLVALHPREFKLLEELGLNVGTVVARSVLLERVWNLRFDPRTKLIESHMSRLRSKLDFMEGGFSIVTVRGSGYCLCDGVSSQCR